MSDITLYAATDEIRTLLDTLEGLEDESLTTEEKEYLATQMQTAVAATVKKADSIIAVLQTLDARANAAKAEAKRLSEHAKRQERNAEKLQSYVIRCMEQAGLKKLDANLGTLSLRNRPNSVVITDESVLPAQFVRLVQTTAPDKKALKEALESGAEIPGADLAIGGHYLVVR
jgi:hypothetical protein